MAKMDEYYKLDAEDFIEDVPCRFKYKEVAPSMYGLSTKDILSMTDKQLTQIVPLKKLAPYRHDADAGMDAKTKARSQRMAREFQRRGGQIEGGATKGKEGKEEERERRRRRRGRRRERRGSRGGGAKGVVRRARVGKTQPQQEEERTGGRRRRRRRQSRAARPNPPRNPPRRRNRARGRTPRRT